MRSDVRGSASVAKKASRRPVPQRARTRRGHDVGRTRQRIVAAALKLFAARGIGSVSLREIVVKSGQGNQSAIHYHFKDKAGLVAAVARHVATLLQPNFDRAIEGLDAKEAAGTLENEDLMAALVMPIISLYHEHPEGPDAVRFIARLASDGGDSGQALLLSEGAGWLMRITPRIAARMPHKPREKLWLQVLLSIAAAAFGLTALGTLQYAPFANGVPIYRGRRDEVIRDFIHFIGRGVLGE